MSLKNVHIGLSAPRGCTDVSLVKGDYLYYHYGVDGFNDQGWGCGYRTLQTISSWICLNLTQHRMKKVPNICEIQKTLVDMGDKNSLFIGSKEWIGSFEVFLVLDQLYQISCKLKHVTSGENLKTLSNDLWQHFENVGSPIMMGGDRDSSSKGILGIAKDELTNQAYLLVLDPHYVSASNSLDLTNCSGKQMETNTISLYNKEALQMMEWIVWRSMSSFYADSFYNLCLPVL